MTAGPVHARRDDSAATAGPSPILAPGTAVEDAAAFLKALSHEGRLAILCLLLDGEKSVTELETLLDQRQSAVSQQLARLRLEGLVQPRREGKVVYYSLQDDRCRRMIALLSEFFCAPPQPNAKQANGTGRANGDRP
ncbi:ArsR family transcriptional regulator [Albidovulum inexpectatum]|uniref:ArsR family transcriptional regulator n=1 Tax=Albidovulum inexpectatum TaxID=196587 RepID=A0A2S5JEB8_9RHOB|nr:metalloregulator ArsR/SmtB family transcription factor [Albidovulum inexpectatum]PPB79739.1 ArsR family transcriptional regulator [Albidovulum inexpectatum]